MPLKMLPLTVSYPSDLSRALVTAETIRGNRTTSITVDKRLRELNFGDWEAMLFSDIESRWLALLMRCI